MGRTQYAAWPGVVIGSRNRPWASVSALAKEPYSSWPPLSVREYASTTTPAAGSPSGVSTRPVIGLAGRSSTVSKNGRSLSFSFLRIMLRA